MLDQRQSKHFGNSQVQRETSLPEVRMATRNDEEDIVRACYRLHEENGQFPLSIKKLLEILEDAFEARGAIIGVIGSPIEACIYLRISSMWYSDVPVWEEFFSFVLPECRQGGNAKSLLKFSKDVSNKTNIPVLIGIISNKKTQAKIRLYRRSFGDPAGAFFLHYPQRHE
jgi:hypothetical protein